MTSITAYKNNLPLALRNIDGEIAGDENQIRNWTKKADAALQSLEGPKTALMNSLQEIGQNGTAGVQADIRGLENQILRNSADFATYQHEFTKTAAALEALKSMVLGSTKDKFDRTMLASLTEIEPGSQAAAALADKLALLNPSVVEAWQNYHAQKVELNKALITAGTTCQALQATIAQLQGKYSTDLVVMAQLQQVNELIDAYNACNTQLSFWKKELAADLNDRAQYLSGYEATWHAVEHWFANIAAKFGEVAGGVAKDRESDYNRAVAEFDSTKKIKDMANI